MLRRFCVNSEVTGLVDFDAEMGPGLIRWALVLCLTVYNLSLMGTIAARAKRDRRDRLMQSLSRTAVDSARDSFRAERQSGLARSRSPSPSAGSGHAKLDMYSEIASMVTALHSSCPALHSRPSTPQALRTLHTTARGGGGS